MHERKGEVHSKFLFHEQRLPFIAVCCKSNVRLSGVDDAVTAIREAHGNERQDPYTCGVVVSVPTAGVGYRGDQDFGDMLLGSSSGCDQCRMVVSNIQAWVVAQRRWTLIMACMYSASRSAAGMTALCSQRCVRRWPTIRQKWGQEWLRFVVGKTVCVFLGKI